MRRLLVGQGASKQLRMGTGWDGMGCCTSTLPGLPVRGGGMNGGVPRTTPSAGARVKNLVVHLSRLYSRHWGSLVAVSDVYLCESLVQEMTIAFTYGLQLPENG